MDAILTSSGQRLYASTLRKFKFPPGWGRLQSVERHLESFRMQEHARASILIPLVLRQHMDKTWIKHDFLVACNSVFRDWIAQNQSLGAVEAVVAAFAAMARSNSTLMSRSLSTDTFLEVHALVIAGRQQYAMLCTAASQATTVKTTEAARKKALILKEAAFKSTSRTRRQAGTKSPFSSTQRRDSIIKLSSEDSQASMVPEFIDSVNAPVIPRKRQRKQMRPRLPQSCRELD